MTSATNVLFASALDTIDEDDVARAAVTPRLVDVYI